MKAAVLSALAVVGNAMPQPDDKPHCVGECQSGLGKCAVGALSGAVRLMRSAPRRACPVPRRPPN
eukprot:COSAG06_NODE_7172_length_2598_cov_6.613045_2_plen_65_part_00